MLPIDNESIVQALGNIEKVVRARRKNSSMEFDFKPFKIQNFENKLAAVDGSNQSLKGVNFSLAFLTAGYLLFEKGKEVASSVEPIRLEVLMNSEDGDIGYLAKHAKYFEELTGELPKGYLEFEKSVDRIRSLMEWKKISDLIDMLDQDDIIIFDGSFMSGTISTSHEFFSYLENKALNKGISLVGLSKDTSLSIDSASLPSVLLEASRKQLPNSNWYVEYEDSYFAKFSRYKDSIYRVDMVCAQHLQPEDILSRIGSYSFAKGKNFGYPYPMQMIHDSVRISDRSKNMAFERFRSQCLERGITRNEFNSMFSIFHNRLDQFSSGGSR